MSDDITPEPPDELDDRLSAAMAASRPRPPAEDARPIDDARVADWVAGRLEGEDAERFVAQLAEDAALRRLVRARRVEGTPDLAAMRRAEQAAVKPTPRRWLRPVLTLAAVLVLAVGVTRLMRPALPEYTADPIAGGVKLDRGEQQGVYFLPQSRLRLDLRPAVPVDAPPAVAVFVDDGADGWTPAPEARVTMGADGAVRIAGRAAAVFGTRYGLRRLRVVVAAGPEPPTTDDGRPVDLELDYRAAPEPR